MKSTSFKAPEFWKISKFQIEIKTPNMKLSFPLPELATEIVTVAGDVGVHEGGRGQDHRRHPDEEQHQRGGLETAIIALCNWRTDGHRKRLFGLLTEPKLGSAYLFWEVRRPGPGDGHVALHGNGGHGEDRRHDGHVGHEVRHLAEDQSEYPVSVDRDMIKKILSSYWLWIALTYSSWIQS